MKPLAAGLFPPLHNPPATFLDNIANVELLVASIFLLVFTVIYFVRFRWYDTPAGKSVLSFLGSLCALMILNTVGRLTGGDYPGRDILRVIVYATVPIAIGYMLWTLASYYRRASVLLLEKRPRGEPIGSAGAPATSLDASSADTSGEAAPPSATAS